MEENTTSSIREATSIGKAQFEKLFEKTAFEELNLKNSNWKEYQVTKSLKTPSQCMMQLKRTTFCYLKVKIQLLLISLNRTLLVYKLNVVYMQTCM